MVLGGTNHIARDYCDYDGIFVRLNQLMDSVLPGRHRKARQSQQGPG